MFYMPYRERINKLMGRNHMINSDFWVDGYLADTKPDFKLFYLYLMTNPHSNIAGVYQLPIKHMVVETGLKEKQINGFVQQLEADKKVFFREGWVIMLNRAKNQSETVQTGINQILDNCPDFIKDCINGIPPTYPMPTLSQNGLNRIELNRIELSSLVLTAWNEKIAKFDWAKHCEVMNDSRKRALSARAKDKYWFENWEKAIELIPLNAWCRGEVGREGKYKNWKPNMDWFLTSKAVVKIIEDSKSKMVETPAEKWVKEKEGKLRSILPQGIDIFKFKADWLQSMWDISEGEKDFADKVKFNGAKNIKGGA